MGCAIHRAGGMDVWARSNRGGGGVSTDAQKYDGGSKDFNGDTPENILIGFSIVSDC